ncbi:hypothetical protein [Bartonella massiliensis]|uniref:hypothetical protein n=1 Tax=Bartonella massiliensis TaxID=929795 RepID=UPI001FE4E528|nr:hypothetical protein [Bartonella massiliensis]
MFFNNSSFLFSQTLEVHANFRRGSFPEEIFIMIVAQEEEPLVLVKNKGFIAISGKNFREKERAIIGPTIKDAIYTIYFFSLESLSLGPL